MTPDALRSMRDLRERLARDLDAVDRVLALATDGVPELPTAARLRPSCKPPHAQRAVASFVAAAAGDFTANDILAANGSAVAIASVRNCLAQLARSGDVVLVRQHATGTGGRPAVYRKSDQQPDRGQEVQRPVDGQTFRNAG